MLKKLIERLLTPFIKNEEDRNRLSEVIIPTFIVRSVYVVLSYLVLIALTRTMGATSYGIYSYSFSIIFMLMNFSYGFEVIALRFTSSYLSQGNKGLWKGLYKWASRYLLIISISIAALVALSILVFVYVLQLIPEKAYTKPILVSCWIIPIYSMMNFYINLLRGQHKSILSFLPDNTVKPLLLLITLLFFRLATGTMSLYLAITLNLISFLVAFVFVVIVFYKTNNLKEITAEYDTQTWKKFIGSLFILSCIGSLYAQVDRVMLGAIKDPLQVGIYYAAERQASFLLFFLYVMNMIIAPSIGHINTPEDKIKVQKMITRTIRWVMLFSLPVFLVLVLFSTQIMHLSGPQFVQGKTALIIICCGQLFNIAFGPVGNFALMTGHQRYNTIYMAIGIFINIALNLILTPRMGFNGTAIATAVCMIFWNTAMFFTIKMKTGIRTWIFG